VCHRGIDLVVCHRDIDLAVCHRDIDLVVCHMGIDLASVSTIVQLNFGIILIVWYFFKISLSIGDKIVI
jgi:hypothetical protein